MLNCWFSQLLAALIKASLLVGFLLDLIEFFLTKAVGILVIICVIFVLFLAIEPIP